MGTHCSSELNRGHIFKSNTTTMKLLLLTVFVADAEPGYYGYPYGYYGHPYAYGYGYGHALPGYSYTHVSRVLGKRSAEADAEPGYYGYPYGFGYYGYPYHYGYRAFGPGIAGHAGGGTSFVARSPQGLGK